MNHELMFARLVESKIEYPRPAFADDLRLNLQPNSDDARAVTRQAANRARGARKRRQQGGDSEGLTYGPISISSVCYNN